MKLQGAYTALITPFNDDKSVDFEGLKKLTEFQLQRSISGLLPLGTTGETPTLSDSEKVAIIELVVANVAGRVPVMVGTGTNSTETTIKNTLRAKELGADCALIVNPYYNKPSQEGLFRHFEAVSTAVEFPIVVYNIRSRTGVNIETNTMLRIAALPNIIGVKEASGDIAQMTDVIRLIQNERDDFSVLSGDDALTFPLMALGGRGVISVASNLVPDKISDLVGLALEQDFMAARELHLKLTPIFRDLFIETNPVPLKFAMSKVGLPSGPVRLPLYDLTEKSKMQLVQTLKEEQLLK